MKKPTIKKNKTSLDNYSGKWVALVDNNHKVIASDHTLKGVVNKIDQMKMKNKPAYFLVPRDDEGPYYAL